MNKQEAIEKIKSTLIRENTRHLGKVVNVYGVIDIIKQIDEPEKPVVPQFVADWYEDNKDEFEYNLYRLCIDFYGRKLHEDLHEWFDNDKNKPIEVLVLMNKFGYEVEKEKLYTVELPNPNSPEHFVLRKNGVNKIVADCYLSDNWKLYKNTWLTESEIKKDFEWAWQLAKEVEE
ncbi:DUF1642 domain-containing protein [Streptococcus gallolyticus]|uniref:DUF1642 domain-containing protein n=1 Tax=Streptococcus gallolyticus TaxID=315405 RepID=UPI00228528B2|nr:DUF1642 domain-containing protein [Streptococcus gallolyticus]MCY7166386.1 DUF1642 domain-containing protein [Streptococcus gallolyticus subsp. gallolyticus]MCY7183776.1 DUF1642 domain-containing protein [Streptococcus gallolyticus subsp. gallolyticus]